MDVRSARARSNAKFAVNGNKPTNQARRHQTYTFPAPIRGWVASESLALAKPGAALVLENWRPTQTGATLRGGSELHATVSAQTVKSFLVYNSGVTEKLFAVSGGSIYDVTTPVDVATPPDASVSGLTENYFSYIQFSTEGGDFILGVNGADKPVLYNGTTWARVDEATHELAYDAETGTFTEGLVVTGGTSGATGTIVELTDAGSTGTLRLDSVSGTFVDNETITDTSTGSATTNIPSGITTLVNITGIATSSLSHVWVYRSRIFFVEKNSKVAWYLPVDSLGGAALDLSLSGIFTRGGTLLSGGTWSLDAGDGMDDKCVFISSLGEVAIYQGGNPGDAADWDLVGRYDIAAPLGKNAMMRAGGDLLLATVNGIVPMSQIVQKDPSALSLAAISRNIEPEWKTSAAARKAKPWEIAKWPEKNIAIVSVPAPTASTEVDSDWGSGTWGEFVWGGGSTDDVSGETYCYVVNLETGAWAKYTGWDVQCLAYSSEQVYFGTSRGTVMKAESGGTDDGAIYISRYAGLFETMNVPSATKEVLLSRPTFVYSQDFIPLVSFSANYVLEWPTPPSSASSPTDVSQWDTAVWDTDVWDFPASSRIYNEWVSAPKSGFALAPMVQVTNGSDVAPDAELVSIDATFESGGVVG